MRSPSCPATWPGAPVVLVCDQLEELWAPGVHQGERAAFLDTVLGLIDDGIVVRCVAAVRGDHVGRLAEHAAFTERVGPRWCSSRRSPRPSCATSSTSPRLRSG